MKKIVFLFLAGGVLGLIWYFGIKQGEFEVNFKAKTLPGDVIQVVKIWNRSLEDGTIMEVDSMDYLRQKIVLDDREYLYEWRFNLENDSTTRVNIRISQMGHELRNKLWIPFTELPIEKDGSDLAHTFYDVLKTHLEITRVRIAGLAEIKEAFCVCKTLETDQLDKANGMMDTYDFLVSFIEITRLEVQGYPFVDVLEWNHDQSKLKYDFCFPVAKRDNLPMNEQLHYKTRKAQKAVKAVYNGNYITSDRAWYALLHYAKKNGLAVATKPIEFFHSNPHYDSNEKEWVAEIFLPIKK